MTVTTPPSGLSSYFGMAEETWAAETQTIMITGTPTGGTFTLSFLGQTTAPINYNAAHADVVTALSQLSTIIGVGGITAAAGPLPGTAVTVTFANPGAQQAMTATGSFTGGSSPAVAVTRTTPGTGYGTLATPTRFLPSPANSSIALQQEVIESEAQIAGRAVQSTNSFALNRRGVTGDREWDFSAVGMGMLLKHALGVAPTITTPTNGILTRQMVFDGLGDPTGMSLSTQEVLTTEKGIQNARTHQGVKITDWTFTCATDAFLKFKASIDAQDENNTTAPASPSFPANFLAALQSWSGPFLTGGATVSINGAQWPARAASIGNTANLNVDRRYLQGNYQKHEPVRKAYAVLQGTLDFDYRDETLWDLWTTGTLATVTIAYQGGVIENVTPTYYYGVSISLQNVRFDGSDPMNNTFDVLEQSVPFKVLMDGVTSPIIVTLTTTDTSY